MELDGHGLSPRVTVNGRPTGVDHGNRDDQALARVDQVRVWPDDLFLVAADGCARPAGPPRRRTPRPADARRRDATGCRRVGPGRAATGWTSRTGRAGTGRPCCHAGVGLPDEVQVSEEVASATAWVWAETPLTSATPIPATRRRRNAGGQPTQTVARTRPAVVVSTRAAALITVDQVEQPASSQAASAVRRSGNPGAAG